MIATPLDLQNNKEFRKGFRGYRQREVDSFIGRVLKDYEQIYRRNLELEERVQDQEERLEQYGLIEDTLQKTLVLAQETAEEVRKSAEKEGELIIEKARLHGEKMLQAMEEQINAMQEELARLKQLDSAHRVQLKSFFEAQLILLEEGGLIEEELPRETMDADEQEKVTVVEPQYFPETGTDTMAESLAEKEVAVALDPEERWSLGL